MTDSMKWATRDNRRQGETMGKQILILGAGFGGLEVATALREALSADTEITIVDQKDYFAVGFSLLDVLVGKKRSDEISFGYGGLAAKGIHFLNERIVSIDPDAARVGLSDRELGYDYLIVALGAELAPDATPGFPERGYHFYSLEAAAQLNERLERFDAGTITVGILGVPYKCPPAPFEATLRLDDYFRSRGLQAPVSLQVMIPGPTALPVAPAVSGRVESMLQQRDIELMREHTVSELDRSSNRVVTKEGTSIDTDLFIGVPVHRPPRVVRESPLGADGWIRVDKRNLRTSYPNVYAVGDCTMIPAGEGAVPKAGTFAEDAARSVAADIVSKEGGPAFDRPFEAHGECFIELGDGQVAAMHANFLGGDRPSIEMAEPTPERIAEKERFVSSRVERWLGA